MRFAYIDSNGNEVGIPSVDALALRIELGAIDENTELYDAQADLWGPANTHEIFHTLSRSAEGGSQGFVAPPPPVAPAPTAPPPTAPPSEPEPEESLTLDSEGLELAEPATPDSALTLAEPTPAEEEKEEQIEVEEGGLGDLDLDLAPATSEAPSDDPVESPSFDFGDMGGGLELEQEFEAPGDDDAAPIMDFSTGPDVGMEGVGDVDPEGGALELERPMAEFSPEAPPAWMESSDGEADGGDVMDFSSVSADVAGPEELDGDVPLRSRRTPRNKPSPAKHRRERSVVGPIVGVVILLAIGMGSYVAWPILRARLAERGGAKSQP